VGYENNQKKELRFVQFCFWRASIAACRDAPRRVVRDENDEKRTVPFSSVNCYTFLEESEKDWAKALQDAEPPPREPSLFD
jgi:hypothetical protein